jgi:hypothetical protein
MTQNKRMTSFEIYTPRQWLRNKIDILELTKNESPYMIPFLENISHKFEASHWDNLSANPYSIDILEKNKESINWYLLSGNPNAMHLLEKNQDKIKWSQLSGNYNAIELLEKNINLINWYKLSSNINAIHLFEANIGRIHWNIVCQNKNAVSFLGKYPHKINLSSFMENSIGMIYHWRDISLNSKDIIFLEKNINKIDWFCLSANPNAIHLLEKNQDKINWSMLSKNENAMDLLEKNQDRINWYWLSSNPSIFVLNYELLKNRMNIIKEELIMTALHPNRFRHYLEMGYNMGDDNWDFSAFS